MSCAGSKPRARRLTPAWIPRTSTSNGIAIDQMIMASRPSTRIARKARSKAESEFATWLMMAKLGGFDDLSSSAQSFLTNYRTRLETMSEAESTALAVREVYSAYYSEMGVAATL